MLENALEMYEFHEVIEVMSVLKKNSLLSLTQHAGVRLVS